MSECSHCGGDGLLHLLTSVGPDPCPRCIPVPAQSVTVGTWKSGDIGFYKMALVTTQCGQKIRDNNGNWHCTREKGHKGFHAGHDVLGVQRGWWR
jgi:hypothetical protein